MKSRIICIIRMYINKVTLMAMPPESTKSSTNSWMYSRCLHPATALPQGIHDVLPLLNHIPLRFMPLLSTPRLIKYNKNQLRRDTISDVEGRKLMGPMLPFLNANLTTFLKEQSLFPPSKNLVPLSPNNVLYPLLSIPLT